MSKKAAVKVIEGKTEEAIVGFLKSLLEKGVVEGIMVPKPLPSKDGFVQTLIRNPEMLNGVAILSPTMPVQSARVISESQRQESGQENSCRDESM